MQTIEEKRRKNTEWRRLWRIKNPDHNLRYKYGITSDDYNIMYQQQGGLCELCRDERRSARGLVVDHTEKSGRVRGLLCDGCNVALGNIEESINTAENIVTYLQRSAYDMSKPFAPIKRYGNKSMHRKRISHSFIRAKE